MSDDDRADRAPLPRNVKILGAVSLAQDTASEMLYPLLPAFITGVLGAPVVALGLAEGLADAAATGTKLAAGRLARASKRRRWIGAGYGLAVIGKAIVAVALLWPIVLAGRVVDRLGKGIRGVPRDALIADDTPEPQRGRAFGLHRALDTLGAVIGPLLGLGLLHLLDGRIRPALAVAVVPALLSLALVGLVREPRDPDTDDRPAEAPGIGPTPTRGPLPPGFWHALAPLAVFSLVNSTDALLLQRAGDLGLSIEAVIIAYVGYNVVYAALSYPAGVLADRIPPALVYAAGLVAFAGVYLGLGLATSATAVWLLFPAYGVYGALTDGISRAWISNTVTGDQRTWALGIHGATTGVGVLVAGLWSGLAWGDGGSLPLTISGVAALAVAAWLLVPPANTRLRSAMRIAGGPRYRRPPPPAPVP